MLDKTQLRAHFKGLRKSFGKSMAEFKTANMALNQNLKNLLLEFCPKGSLLLAYSGYQSEPHIDLDPTFRWALPRIYADETMRFFECSKKSQLEENQLGILEPVEDLDSEVTGAQGEAVIVPGVAFDQNGIRLGLGKGFYDRFLNPLPQLRRIGVCFSFQLSQSDLPKESWDEPMDWLITELGVIRFNRKG